jgi:MoxR-like ATPase
VSESSLSAPSLAALEKLDGLIEQVGKVFHGKRETIRLAVAALLARGHLLVEDVPGVGKTTLARGLAAALGLDFRRLQFTSDLLPSDVIGVSVYNPKTTRFETRPGPIFANVVLVDEINRAPPRTQSGLLQAMQEGSVTIESATLRLPDPFLVLATQNPFEYHGTYPLPESQLDRFLMRVTLGYPDEDAERRILEESGSRGDPTDDVRVTLEPDQIRDLQADVEAVHVEPSVMDYLVQVVRTTRESASLKVGASPRAAVGLLAAARAWAMTAGRDFVVPDDVRDLVTPCLAHRVVLGGSAGIPGSWEEAAAALESIVERVPLPI